MHIEDIRDESVWEAFLLLHSKYQLFQSWDWGEVVSKRQSVVRRVGLYEKSMLIGVASIVLVRAKRGTYLHIRHGPVCISQTYESWRFLLDWLIRHAKQSGALFIRMSPLLPASHETMQFFHSLGCISSATHEVDAERCWVLDLDVSEDVLLSHMDKTTRYEIRRAERLGATVQRSSHTKDIDMFLSLYAQTSKRHGFVPHAGIVEEFEQFCRHKHAMLFFGYFEKNLLAGALIIFTPTQAIYHHGASLPSTISVSRLVQWEAIKEAKKRGLRVYNFWGVSPVEKSNHPWHGLSTFKRGFGGNERVYMHAVDVPVNPLWIIPRAIDTIESKIRGYSQ